MPRQFFLPLRQQQLHDWSPELRYLAQASSGTGKQATTPWTLAADAELFSYLINELGLQTASVQSAALSDVQKRIEKLRFPKVVSMALHTQISAKHDRFFRLCCVTPSGKTAWISELQGETTVLDAIRTAWSEAVALHVKHGEKITTALLNCQLLIQEQLSEPIAHGEMFTRHPSTGDKHHNLILLWPGAASFKKHPETAHHLVFDIRMMELIQEYQPVFTEINVRTPGGLRRKKQEGKLAISPQAFTAVLEKINALKRSVNTNLHVQFEIAGTNLIITWIEAERSEAAEQLAVTRTKILAALTDMKDVLQNRENLAGIGLLRSENIYQSLSIHPSQLIQTGKQKLLTEHISTFLSEADRLFPHRRVVYRLQNMTSSELQKLDKGGQHEDTEPNPYLGMRGMLRMINQPDLFEPELSAFGSWLKRRHAPTGLIVPFVRSTSEWHWALSKWHDLGLFEHSLFEPWFQVATPENLLHLGDYVTAEVKGVLVNLRTITSLYTGVDPDNPQLLASYPSASEVQTHILESAAATIREIKERHGLPDILIHLHTEQFNYALVSAAVESGFDGVVIHPSAATICQRCVTDVENKMLNSIE